MFRLPKQPRERSFGVTSRKYRGQVALVRDYAVAAVPAASLPAAATP